MNQLEEKSLLSTLTNHSAKRRPVWFLRQAGRYLPEYQKIRKELDFVQLCNTPEVAATVTLQPLKRFDLDAAIIFSDILIPLAAVGQNLTFAKDHGPILCPRIMDEKSFQSLNTQNFHENLKPLEESLRLVKESLEPHVSLIGFCAAPLTLMTYMMEGQGSKTFPTLKNMLHTDKNLFYRILDFVCDLTVEYFKLQDKNGIDAFMIFDTWATCLSPRDYTLHYYPKLKEVFYRIKKESNTPIIFYPGQSLSVLQILKDLPLEAIAVDWRIDLKSAIKVIRKNIPEACIQGNLDPMILQGNKDTILEAVRDILKTADELMPQRHIFNVGHGLLPETPPEAVTWVVDEIRRWDDRF